MLLTVPIAAMWSVLTAERPLLMPPVLMVPTPRMLTTKVQTVRVSMVPMMDSGDNGYNIALFNLADAELTTCVHQVKSLEFTFDQTDNPYWIEEDGIMKTLSIDVIGPAGPSSGSED